MSVPPTLETTLPPVPASARTARQAVCSALEGWPASVVDTAELLAGELVGNAVRHAGSPLTLRVRVGDDTVQLEVTDAERALPRRFDPAPDDLSGRGLALVDALATDWGAEPGPGRGKTVWCVIQP
jgi:serine/threonine-protein kinase RsbW